MNWPLILLLVLVACLLGTVALCFGDAAVDYVRDAVRQWRHGRDDDPYDDSDKHRCPVCHDLDADEANGILRTDFELWSKEMESTP